MNSDKILQSNLLDIVFEHRNKDYGAYPLRKFYNNRLYKAMGVVFMLAVVLCLLSFLQPHTKLDYIYTVVDNTKLAEPPKDKPKEPKPVQPKAPAAAATSPVHNMDILTPPKIAPNNQVITTVHSLSDSADIGDREIKGKPGGPVLPHVDPPVTGDPGPPVVTVPPVDQTTPINTPEIMPSFPGGTDALRKFLQNNLETPQDLEEGQTVSVQIRFVVGYDGKLKGFETVQDGGAAFNNEVMRVLKKMPQWIPGKTRGQNVSVYYVLPVKFTLAP